jgi:phospholipid-binding lipoprotein MlaA
VDAYTNPHAYIGYKPLKYGLYGLYIIDARANLLSLDETLKNVYDPYAFIRDAYLQRREYLVTDGKVTSEELVDPDADDPGAPAKPPSDTTPADKPPPDKPPPDKPAPDKPT